MNKNNESLSLKDKTELLISSINNLHENMKFKTYKSYNNILYSYFQMTKNKERTELELFYLTGMLENYLSIWKQNYIFAKINTGGYLDILYDFLKQHCSRVDEDLSLLKYKILPSLELANYYQTLSNHLKNF